jgi:hypothetical protein
LLIFGTYFYFVQIIYIIFNISWEASLACPLPTSIPWDPSEIGILSYHTHLKMELTNFMELSPSSEAVSHAALKNFPAFYGTRRFITVFTRALHWSIH